MAITSSGIVTCLLDEGKTANSMLAVPLKVENTSIYDFIPRSKTAQGFDITHHIICNDSPMDSRFAIEDVDKPVTGAFRNKEQYLGRVVLCGGNFRQILPIVHGEYRSQTGL
jgi:PIF1-like helicase